MFRHRNKKQAATAGDLRVEFHLEAQMGGVERSVHAYLQDPSETARKDLVSDLEQLDDQISQSDAYETTFAGIARYGSGTQGAVIGETNANPLVDEVPGSEFRAQVALAKAAKDEVRKPTPATMATLSDAANSLAAIRTQAAQPE